MRLERPKILAKPHGIQPTLVVTWKKKRVMGNVSGKGQNMIRLRISFARVCFLLLTALIADVAIAAGEPRLRVMTYNIRLDTTNDGANQWRFRRDMLTSQIALLQPDIFGLQEVVINQKRDIAEAMRFDFALVGNGRDDGKDGGESSPIGYNIHRFNLLDGGTFWLSPTPDLPSKGWDAAYPRVATWARLREKRGGKIILIVNTHWDHVGVEARTQSALQLRAWLTRHRKQQDHILLIGDFNAEPGSEPLAILTDVNSPVPLRSAALNSTFRPFGPKGTFNDFKLVPETERTIDHILVGGQKGREISIGRYAVVAQNVDGRMISDHYPVVADLKLN